MKSSNWYFSQSSLTKKILSFPSHKSWFAFVNFNFIKLTKTEKPNSCTEEDKGHFSFFFWEKSQNGFAQILTLISEFLLK